MPESRGGPRIRVRPNYPYAGNADGLTTYLRRRFPAGSYLGIELEINQRYAAGSRGQRQALQQAVVAGLHDALTAAAPLA
ncbi:MAG TPA: hypothetical protein VF814_09280 [Casimicrobiaceae bacterium]